jgi:hypothetical protein
MGEASVKYGLFLALLWWTGCTNNEYRFERMEDGQWIATPLKFDAVRGSRDGASVEAEAQFSDGADSAQFRIVLFLRPPAEFRSGSHRVTIGGKTIEGAVESTSLTYLGGQAAQPSVGGVFILKDARDYPAYRVRMPPTLLAR